MPNKLRMCDIEIIDSELPLLPDRGSFAQASAGPFGMAFESCARCAVATMRLCMIGVPARCATHESGFRLLANGGIPPLNEGNVCTSRLSSKRRCMDRGC
jgi:hypothetical protein